MYHEITWKNALGSDKRPKGGERKESQVEDARYKGYGLPTHVVVLLSLSVIQQKGAVDTSGRKRGRKRVQLSRNDLR